MALQRLKPSSVCARGYALHKPLRCASILPCHARRMASARATWSPCYAARSPGDARGVSELLKALTQEIRGCKSLEDLEGHYFANASEYNEAWVTLAKLPGSRADRAAFARKHLLGKGLTFVHQMEMRSLSNMLWAIGKLRVDLAQEGTGPYLADAIDEHVRKLVRAGGMEDGKHVEQLLYGLEFSQYPWSHDLLALLVEHTIPVFRAWDLKAQGEVLFRMSQLSLKLRSDQQLLLAKDVEEVVSTWSLDDMQTYRSAPVIVQGIHALGLPVTRECVQSLQRVMLNTPVSVYGLLGSSVLAFGLMRLVNLGCSVEGSRWENVLLTLWRAVPRPAEQKSADLSQALSALLVVPDFAPSEELLQQLAEVATRHAESMNPKTARIVAEAAQAWGVALQPKTVQQLKHAAGSKVKQHGAGGKRSQGPRGRGPAAPGKAWRAGEQ